MPLFETPQTARARVQAALRLCHDIDRSCILIQTRIDQTTANLILMNDTYDDLSLKDLGLVDMERELMLARDTLHQLSSPFKPQVLRAVD